MYNVATTVNPTENNGMEKKSRGKVLNVDSSVMTGKLLKQ